MNIADGEEMMMFKIFKKKAVHVYAPVDGIQIPLEAVNDPVFATKMIGAGAAFELSGDTIYSPCAGTIHLIADTLHAFGIVMPGGIEILIHVGLETVRLKGQGLTPLRKQGDSVQVGTPLLKIDRGFMKEQQVDLTTIVVIVKDNGLHTVLCDNTQVSSGTTEIFTLQ